MKLIRNTIVLGFAIGVGAASGCSSRNAPGFPGDVSGARSDTTGVVGGTPSGSRTGTVGLQLNLGPGITLGTLQYTITNPTLAGFATISHSVDVSGSQVIGFSVTLPVANGYKVSLSAIDSNGDGCSGGPAPFNVIAAQTNAVGLTLVCTETVDSGVSVPDVMVTTAVFTADASLEATVIQGTCAAVNSLFASPNETNVGATMSLTATGIDSNYQSSDVVLTWTATGGVGSLAATTGTSNTFTCTAAGTETITVTATISNGGASCPVIGSVPVTLSCDLTADASVPEASAPEASAPEASAPEASAPEASAPETGVAEGGGTGPLTPCTAVGQTNCARASGNTSGLATEEEAYFIQKDITAGRVSAAGPISLADPTSSCYSCLVNAAAINATARHVTGVECGDLAANFTNGSSATVSGPATCIAAIQCLSGSTGAGCTAGSAGVGNDTFCYCGAGGYGTGASAGPSVCGTTNALHVNGNCLATELAGFNSTVTGTNLSNFAQSSQPSGMANQFVESAIPGNCSAMCLQ
jgi:hypothetical protein